MRIVRRSVRDGITTLKQHIQNKFGAVIISIVLKSVYQIYSTYRVLSECLWALSHYTQVIGDR